MNYDRRSTKRWLNRYWTLIYPRRRRSRLRVFPFVARGSWFTHRSEHASTATLQISYSWIIFPSIRYIPVFQECQYSKHLVYAITMRAHVPFECNIRINVINLMHIKWSVLNFMQHSFLYTYALWIICLVSAYPEIFIFFFELC